MTGWAIAACVIAVTALIIAVASMLHRGNGKLASTAGRFLLAIAIGGLLVPPPKAMAELDCGTPVKPKTRLDRRTPRSRTYIDRTAVSCPMRDQLFGRTIPSGTYGIGCGRCHLLRTALESADQVHSGSQSTD
jgi:hypothetical protein